MDSQLAAVDAAAITAGKRQVVHAAIASRLAGEGSSGDATPTSSTAAAAAAAAAVEEPWDGLIAAVPGPLGAERPAQRARVCMGYGLAPPDQAALQAETAAQDCYLDAVGTAVDALRSMGLVSAAQWAACRPTTSPTLMSAG